MPFNRLTGQTIDSLHTDEQVLKFVSTLHSRLRDYKYPVLVSRHAALYSAVYKARLKEYGAVPYAKADFDNNGQTDLLFNGFVYHSKEKHTYGERVGIVVMAFGKDSFRVIDLPLEYPRAEFFASQVLFINGQTLLRTIQINRKESDTANADQLALQIDTLTYAYDHFVERSTPFEGSIKKITFNSGGGMALYPLFTLTLVNDSATLAIEELNRQNTVKTSIDSGGLFQAKLDSAISARIYGILRCINFPRLKNRYTSNRYDAGITIFRIDYNDGKVKGVNDFAVGGSYGVAALEWLLNDLKDEAPWKLISRSVDLSLVWMDTVEDQP